MAYLKPKQLQLLSGLFGLGDAAGDRLRYLLTKPGPMTQADEDEIRRLNSMQAAPTTAKVWNSPVASPASQTPYTNPSTSYVDTSPKPKTSTTTSNNSPNMLVVNRPPSYTTSTNPNALRDANIAESQRLAAARLAGKPKATVGSSSGGASAAVQRSNADVSAGSGSASGEDTTGNSGFNWDAITGIVGTVAATTKTILDQQAARKAERNQPPAVVAPVSSASGGDVPWAKIGIGLGVGVIGILLVKKLLS